MVRNNINNLVATIISFVPIAAKFDSIVPGTLGIKSNNTPLTATSTPWTTPPIALTTNTTSSESDLMTLNTITSTIAVGSNIVEVESTLFYILIGAGSGILILLFIILIMFLSACYLATNKGRSYTITAAVQDNEGENPGLYFHQIQGTYV